MKQGRCPELYSFVFACSELFELSYYVLFLFSVLLDVFLDDRLWASQSRSRAAQSCCSLIRTASLRFDGALNVDITEFQTNLVPYP